MREYLLVGLALLWTTGAQAALAISASPTKHMSCVGGICTATAKAAVLNVDDLQTMLASSDVTVRTGSGAVTIGVMAPLTWVSGHHLTLDADLSIHFDAAVVVEGTAGMTIVTNHGGGTAGELSFFEAGSLSFWDTSSSLVIDGSSYTLVGDIATLDQDIAADAKGHYALASDYDAAPDGPYAGSPVGTPFGGTFEGLGHSVRNLTINVGNGAKKYVGFFRQLASNSFIRDFGLENFVVIAPSSNTLFSVGALVGRTDGSKSQRGCVCNSHASGTLTIGAIDNFYVGGLVGYNGGRISNSHCGCAVSLSTALQSYAGGVAGYNGGKIETSYATGTISGPYSAGLVGQNVAVGGENWTGQIANSYSTATVYAGGSNSGGGGLVAVNQGSISNSHASGDVHVLNAIGAPVGGLVAINTGGIFESYATGNVGQDGFAASAGGLVAANFGGVTHSYATGAVKGDGSVGGLVGENQGPVDNAYALGAADAGSDGSVGGLIGHQAAGDIDFSYSAGTVSGGHRGNKGGLIGRNDWDHETSAYWDITTSGTRRSAGGTGLSDAALKAALPDGFDPSIWGQNAAINGGLPYLIVIPPN